jgi:hypothetical protein
VVFISRRVSAAAAAVFVDARHGLDGHRVGDGVLQ